MKALLFSLIISFTISLSSCGQKKATDKGIASFDSLIPPKPIGWTSDFENVFSRSQINYLDSIIGDHHSKTSNEIAIVTLSLDSSIINAPGDFERFSLALFSKWGVGEKNKNNGIGMLISVNLRKIRIETGYGLNEKLTDHEAKNIIDTIIIPEFKKADYFRGIVNGLNAIFKEIQ